MVRRRTFVLALVRALSLLWCAVPFAFLHVCMFFWEVFWDGEPIEYRGGGRQGPHEAKEVPIFGCSKEKRDPPPYQVLPHQDANYGTEKEKCSAFKQSSNGYLDEPCRPISRTIHSSTAASAKRRRAWF